MELVTKVQVLDDDVQSYFVVMLLEKHEFIFSPSG